MCSLPCTKQPNANRISKQEQQLVKSKEITRTMEIVQIVQLEGGGLCDISTIYFALTTVTYFGPVCQH